MQMPIWDHLEELRERVLVGALAAGIAVLICFAFSKDLVVFLEAPVASQGVRFLQLSPGEFFFTTLKVGHCDMHSHFHCDWRVGVPFPIDVDLTESKPVVVAADSSILVKCNLACVLPAISAYG